MSFFDWLLPRSKSPASLPSPAYEGPASPSFAGHAEDPDLKVRRQERRERLYAVVREAMLRSEVLASRYKFKVLSLDTHGRQFLIMIDLMDVSAVSPDRFAGIEHLIVAHAAQQHGIYVKSVYWRATESLQVTSHPTAHGASASSAAAVSEAPLAPSVKPVVVPPVTVRKPTFDPIDQAEVLAFKKAIGAIPTTPEGKKPGQIQTSGSRRVLTGFEDTQILNTSEDPVSPLSSTQFGELL